MYIFKFLLTGLVFICLSAIAFADDQPVMDQAREHYATGKYDEAVNLIETLESAESLSLSAEIISAKVMLGHFEKPRKAATRARKMAQKAQKLAPDLYEAKVQYALARGFETQSSSPFRAWRKNLIPKTRKAIENVQAENPDDPRGDALMGAWHLGIVRKAGAGRADDLFSATESDGIRFYEAALKRAPADIIILSNFTAVLISIDPQKHFDKAMMLLMAIDKAEPSNAVERDVKKLMAEMIVHIDNADKLKVLADTLLGDENDDSDDE